MQKQMGWQNEGILLSARETNGTVFWKNFSFQRNLGFEPGAVDKKGESA